MGSCRNCCFGKRTHWAVERFANNEYLECRINPAHALIKVSEIYQGGKRGAVDLNFPLVLPTDGCASFRHRAVWRKKALHHA